MTLIYLLLSTLYACATPESTWERKTASLESYASGGCNETLRELLKDSTYYVTAFTGKIYNHLYPIEGHDVYRLGWGAEASSYRVVSKENPEKVFTRKVFNIDQDSDFYSEGTRDRELRRLALIKDLINKCPSNQPCFKLIDVIGPKSEDIIDFEYIPGQTIDKIVGDLEIPLEYRIQLKESFEKMAMNLIEKIKEEYGPNATDFRAMNWMSSPKDINYKSFIITIVADEKMLKKGFETETKIWIKPDNIILNTNTDELTLIDPY